MTSAGEKTHEAIPQKYEYMSSVLSKNNASEFCSVITSFTAN